MNQSERIFSFGKYKGLTVSHILEIDPSYILWISANVNTFSLLKKEIRRAEKAVQSLKKNGEKEKSFMETIRRNFPSLAEYNDRQLRVIWETRYE